MERASDEILLARTAEGDKAAFAVLVERHRRRIMGVAYRVCLNRSDAEEVVQEAFMRVWIKAPDWQPEAARGAKLSTWLARVVINLSIDRRRRVAPGSLDLAAEIATAEPSPADRAEGGEIAARIRAALAALPERQRAALALCQFEGFSNEAAAAALEISVGALESLLVRARRSLRAALADLVEARS